MIQKIFICVAAKVMHEQAYRPTVTTELIICVHALTGILEMW